ncbi:hypothetical protein N784_10895 [Pontibacillus litoralis JSM 072002]|uniref:Uncharacterized protein n=1 Tax=Pontibacillus litoralis JSM 072002 TaxID=1385512 RepID=A0A0A5HXC6_9BACI|nr:hypothetical protein N784_10895 [Pontibacillus litoralis JSM 072002]
MLKEEGVSSSWQILEDFVPLKYYLKPVICNRFLRLAERAGFPPLLPDRISTQIAKGRIPIVRPLMVVC